MAQSVIIIGAGAAGLAAGRTLHEDGFAVTLLEARERIGGRAWTSYDLAPYPIELGAELIHGASVMTWDLLKRYGLDARPLFPDESVFVKLNGVMQPYEDLIEEDWEEVIWEAAEAWFEAGKPDASLREVLDAAGVLTDHNAELARLVNNIFAEDYGADLDKLGAAAFIEATFEDDGTEDGDFGLRDGYTQLMARLADGLDIRLNTPVKQIRYSPEGVHITTVDDTEFEAKYAIVTLPLGVLKAGDVVFDPPLPAEKQDAINNIGAGKINKLILTFKEAFWPEDMSAVFTALDSQMWWRPGWGRQGERPILTAYAGGSAGAVHSTMSEDQMVQYSLKHLAQVFGQDVSGLLVGAQFVNWGADPYSKIGYSFGAVGSAGMRATLAAPINDTLYFAGEACNPIRPQTVHGAMETGIQAAKRIGSLR